MLLYELLTGTTPFSKERFKQAAYDEIRRIIREEDPPKPSTRLSHLSSRHAPREEPGHVTRSVTATLASVAAQRQTEPAKLTRLVRGDLDWIVMKALEKDRNRRYETANGFAMDVQRYLADEAVQACPPSVGYRLRKFARRNKAGVVMASIIGVALLLAVGTLGWAVRDEADQEAGSSVSVLLGGGDGTFAPATTYASHNFSFLTLADFDDDGNIDVAVGGWSPTQLFLGNGDGTLQPPSEFDIGAEFWTLADFNADGNLDQVHLGSHLGQGTLDVSLGNGDGTFAPPIWTPVEGTDLVVADFNADGRPDAAVIHPGPQTFTGVVTILLNDGVWPPPPDPSAPSITIDAVTLTEGNTGTVSATFVVTLSAPSDQTVTVVYATSDASATAGSDYQAASATLIIPAGQTTGTITVAVIGDRLAEPNETFVVNLRGATNATIADGLGVCTILDDEPHISISDVTKAEGKKGKATLFTFTVTLSAAYDEAVTMSYRTVNGTATTGDNDYVAKSGTITFAPGETTKTITIEVKGDRNKETNEIFYLDLFGLSSNALFTKSRGIGTILNDD